MAVVAAALSFTLLLAGIPAASAQYDGTEPAPEPAAEQPTPTPEPPVEEPTPEPPAEEATPRISSVVFEDSNNNGIQDPDEPGVTGVTVRVLNAFGNTIGTASTDSEGNWVVEGLPARDYTVQVDLPSGYTFTGQNAGANVAVERDAEATGTSGMFSLAPGASALIVLGTGGSLNGAPDVLAFTGSSTEDLAAIAAALIVTGALALHVSRRFAHQEN